MGWTLAGAVRALFDQANALWPDRSRASDGTIGDSAHSARVSDHNPDERGVVHAGDLTHDPAHGCDNHRNAEMVKDDPRAKYVIWNRRIYNPSVAPYWRAYTGSNPHDHHMHVSVVSGPLENDTRPWFDEEDHMTADDWAKVDAKFLRVIVMIKESEARLLERIKFKSRKQRAQLAEIRAEIAALEAQLPEKVEDPR